MWVIHEGFDGMKIFFSALLLCCCLSFAVCAAAVEYDYINEEDTSADGQTDTWVYIKDDQVVMKDVDMDMDGKPDSRKYFRDGRVYRSTVIARRQEQESQQVKLDDISVYPVLGSGE